MIYIHSHWAASQDGQNQFSNPETQLISYGNYGFLHSTKAQPATISPVETHLVNKPVRSIYRPEIYIFEKF